MAVATGVLAGFKDKLYWRRCGLIFHCFKGEQRNGYRSLCGRWRLARSGGQAIDRPEVRDRCTRCDVAEIERRGKEESLPARLRR